MARFEAAIDCSTHIRLPLLRLPAIVILASSSVRGFLKSGNEDGLIPNYPHLTTPCMWPWQEPTRFTWLSPTRGREGHAEDRMGDSDSWGAFKGWNGAAPTDL